MRILQRLHSMIASPKGTRFLMSIKEIGTSRPVLPVLANRWSPRAFDPNRRVGLEKLITVFEAARLTASAWNEQPWRFLLGVRGQDDTWDRLFDCLSDANRVWAKDAPVLVLAVCKQFLGHRGPASAATYRHGPYDLGQAVMALVVQAQSMGVSCHQMAGFCPTKASQAFDIPQLFEPMSVIAMGYQGNVASLPEKLRECELAPRMRKYLEDIVFKGTWGTPATFQYIYEKRSL